ncbi:MAG: choice-of-anchor D domain-containing protein [Verrucomicrobia bacterium]|nr:choice-of-anchor D domain-containing protein [Verrucomicrobiota bacterium]
MKETIRPIIAALLWMPAMSLHAAEVIHGVTATASSEWGNPITATSLIDNSGLRSAANPGQAVSYDPTAVHTYDTSAVGQWHNNPAADPNGANPQITFDLHGTYNLSQIHIWNGNQWGFSLNLTARGVAQLDVLVSTNGTDFTEVLSNQSLTRSPVNTYVATQTFSLAGNNGITHVRLRVDSNHGDTYTGLSEVMFSAIPDPGLTAPASHDFGSVGSNTTPQAQLPVTNDGPTQTLHIENVEVVGANADAFTVDRFPTTLAANGGADTIDVTFDPAGVTGTYSAMLWITSDRNGVPGTLTTVPLAATAVNDPGASAPAGRDFGLIHPDSTVQLPVTVTNSGPSQTLHITETRITGAGASHFTVNGAPTSILPLGSGNIDLTFHPDGTDGDYDAVLEIVCDHAGTAGTVVSVNLSGGTNRLADLSKPTIIGAATAFNPDYAAANLFDGTRRDYATAGAGAGDPFSQANGTWVELDMGAPVTLDRLILITRANNNDVVGESRLILSDDTTFDATDTIHTFATTGQNGQGIIRSFPASAARYVRWEAGTSIGTYPNLGGVEMRLLDTPAGWQTAAATVVGGATPFSPDYALEYAANGDAGGGPGVEYASASTGAGMYVDFDLGASMPVLGFDFFDRIAPVDRTTAFDLLFSDDPAFATGVTTVSVRSGSQAWGVRRSLPSGLTARYVRLDATAAYGADSNTGIQEILFYTSQPTGTPYEQYISTTWGITGTDAAPDADADHDGLENAVEFVLGSDPTKTEPNMAPTLATTATDLTFTFRRTTASAPDNPVAQYGSDLTNWTPAQHGQNGITITTIPNGFGAGVDSVSVTIPKSLATGSGLFVRLAVSVSLTQP